MLVYDVAVLGGGASGLVCAIECAKYGLKTVILEKSPKIGKKLLVTGNGRCNLTNMDMDKKYFFSGEIDFVEYIITRHTPEKIIEFFRETGLITRVKDGLVYPLSNKAQAVADCLRFAALKYRIDIITEFNINALEKAEHGFIVFDTENKFYSAKNVVVACGLKAYDGTDTGLKLLEGFGHDTIPLYPGLVQLKSDDAFVSGLKGVKFIGSASACHGGKTLKTETGEILFTDYGVSGIAILQLSPLYSVFGKIDINFDFLPFMKHDEVLNILLQRFSFFQNTDVTVQEFLTGIVDKKLGHKILKRSGIGNLSLLIENLSEEQIKSIAKSLKNVKISISGHNGFKNAQVCGGGVNLRGFNRETMESKFEKGLFATGEALDAMGLCGGYNLHWAWATAMQAACGIRRTMEC